MSSDVLATASPGTTPAVALLGNLPNAILLIDDYGVITYANVAAELLFARGTEALIGKPFSSLLADSHREAYEQMVDAFTDGERVEMLGERREVIARQPDGTGVAIELSLSQVQQGRVRVLAATAHDMRERKHAEAKLRRLAEEDPLTSLRNRVSFERALTSHVDYAGRYGGDGAVIALGVDYFKYVNESLGVAGGDSVLTELANLIAGRLRKADVAARVGGDVFGILVHGANRTAASALAEELLTLVRRHSFVIGGEGIRITLSAGVTSLDQRQVPGAELLAEAEAAMSDAQEAGRDRVVAWDPKERPDIGDRRAWTERIRRATEGGLFVLNSQPIMDLHSDTVTQHEILLRMREDGGGLVSPAAFLGTAERFGLIGAIDRWVTRQAIRLIGAHNRAGRELILEVNLSGKTLGDLKFPEEVKRALTNSEIDPASLIFEVTETAAVADIQQARSFAHALARVGCRFALDDFGSGYASFYYLKHLPISYLKIDGEFVKDLPRSPVDQRIIHALVQVCTGIGVKTIAEFVEDQQTLDLLRELGVDFAQGYHLSKPVPVAELKQPTAG